MLGRVHPEIDLDVLLRELLASGVDPSGVDLAAAAVDVFEAKAGQRVGSPTRYVAASIRREPHRWPAQSWEALLDGPPTPAPRDAAHPSLSPGHPDVTAIAMALGLVPSTKAGQPERRLRDGDVHEVAAFIATYPGGWEAAVEWASRRRPSEGAA